MTLPPGVVTGGQMGGTAVPAATRRPARGLSPTGRLSAASALVLFGLTAGVLLYVGLPVFQSAYPTGYWFAVFVCCAVLLVPFVMAALQRRFDPFEPIYLVAVTYGLYFVYAPTVDYAAGREFLFGRDIVALLPQALEVASLGILALYVGYYTPPGAVFAASTRALPRVNPRVALRLSIVLMVTAVFSFGAYIATSGQGWTHFLTLGQVGPDQLLTPAEDGALPFSNYLYLTIDFLPAVLLLLHASGRGGKVALAGVFIATLLIYTTIGFRFRMLILAMAPIIYWYLRTHRRPTLASMGVGAVVAALLIGLVGDTRGAIRSGTQVDVELLTVGEAHQTFIKDLSLYQPFAAVVEAFPKEHSFTGHKPFTYVLVHPIPRVLWPEKPEPPVVEMVRAAFSGDAAVTAGVAYPNIGEFYASAGLAGVIVGMALFGILLRWLFEYTLRHPANELVGITFAISLPFLVLVVSRGYFVQIVQTAGYFLAPVLLAAWLSRSTGRRKARV